METGECVLFPVFIAFLKSRADASAKSAEPGDEEKKQIAVPK